MIEMGSSIGSCFDDKKVHQVSPISSLCHASAEKPPKGEEVLDSPKVVSYESPTKNDIEIVQDNSEIFVEEVVAPKPDNSQWILTEDAKEVSIASSANSDDLGDKDSTIDFLTDDILSMMIFSDIPAHPYRDGKNMFQNFKNKFPFNKPTGFDSSQAPVAELMDEIVQFIMTSPGHVFNKVKNNMNVPLDQDPMSLLHTLQMPEPQLQAANTGAHTG